MNDNSALKSKATKGMLWSAVEKFSVQGGQFIIGIVLARILMPEDFGLIGMLSIFIVIAQSLVDSGMGAGLIQKKDRTNIDFSTVFIFNFAISLGIYLILFASAPAIADFYNMPKLVVLTRVLTLSIVIDALALVQRSKLIIKVDFKTIAKINFVTVVISGSIAIYAAYQGFGVWSLVILALTKTISTVILLWYFSPWRVSLFFSSKSFTNLFGYGYKLLLSGLYSQSFNEIYNVTIGKVYTASDLGFYTTAKKFVDITAGTVTNIIDQVSFPILATLQDEKEKLVLVFGRVTKMTSFFILPAMTLLALVAEPFIKIVLTDKWLPAVPLLQWLCFARILYPLSILNLNILKAVGRSDLFLKVNLSKLPILILTLVITVPLGIKAIVIGHLITAFIGYLINTYLPGKMYGYGALKQLKDMLPLVVAICIMSIIVIFSTYFITNDVLMLFSRLAIGITIYLLMCYLLKINELKELSVVIKKTFQLD
jgi:O-antigen/teichoic acid export membrane protein